LPQIFIRLDLKILRASQKTDGDALQTREKSFLSESKIFFNLDVDLPTSGHVGDVQVPRGVVDGVHDVQ
jgi:hypothetical protein